MNTEVRVALIGASDTRAERLFKRGTEEEPSKELRRPSRLEKFGVKPR
jgi:hypothetical protein